VDGRIHRIKTFWKCGLQEGIFEPSRDKKKNTVLFSPGRALLFF
jgi:hypothetical protein